VHAVVALVLPAVEAFDLAIPAQVFADPGLPRRYEFTVCAPVPAARIREARRLLEATDLPVEVIAARCGLGTAANLRLHLARDAGATPTAYRAAYQGRSSDAREAGS
jgi:hypothetical protein